MAGHHLHGEVGALLRDAARTLILPGFRNLARADIIMKSPGELVTRIDRDAESLITRVLLALWPRSVAIGEEACADDPALLDLRCDDRVWIVDPLDGTSNFVAGHAPFGMIVALAERGVTQAAWLYDPLTDRLCHAARGQGAWINGVPIGPPHARRQRPVAALATQFMNDTDRDLFTSRAIEACELVPIPRCAAEHYPRLALGQNDLALFHRTLPWDHAAGALFLTEAGGHVARWDGSAYDFSDDRRGLLAATSKELWDWGAARLLSEVDDMPRLEPQAAVSPYGSMDHQ